MPEHSKQDLLVRPNDYVYSNQDFDSSPVVLEDYKLVFFPIEGNGAETWRRLFRRMLGLEDWKNTTKQFEGLAYLSEYDQEKATEFMTSPDFTRSIIVQDPKTRLLSSYIDKVLKDSNNTFMRSSCCGTMKQLTLPGSEKHLKACASQNEPISFALFAEIVQDCDHSYWRPQSRRMEPKYYKFINFIGHCESIRRDAKQLLQNIGAWEKYGRDGWGSNGKESIFDSAPIWNVASAQRLHPQNYTGILRTIASKGSVYKTDYDEKMFNLTE
jgi:hypothetical protein